MLCGEPNYIIFAIVGRRKSDNFDSSLLFKEKC